MRSVESLDEKQIPTPFSLCGLPPHTGVLLAYSGGADSSALLEVLCRQAEQYGFSLTLLHFHHGIRGEEADRDESFCRDVAERYACPILIERADVPTLAKEHKRGIEEEARLLRYEFFGRAMETTGAKILVTAHHADDNLETILFRLARGSSLKGLCGISPARRFGEGFLVRPLLALSKEEILAFCRERKIPFVEDSTNQELSYARNFIRKNLVPDLKQLFDHPETRVSRMTEWLREDEAYLSALADKALLTISSKGLLLEDAKRLPPPVLRRVLSRFAAERIGEEPDGKCLTRLTLLVETGKGKVELSGGAMALIENGRLNVLLPEPVEKAAFPAFGPGEWVLNGVRIQVKEGASQIPKNNKNICVVAFDPADPLFWRVRTGGETILLRGHHRKLRKCYREAAVPARLRERMPLLCDGEGLLFAPYVGLRDHAAEHEGSLYTVRVTLPDIEEESIF